ERGPQQVFGRVRRRAGRDRMRMGPVELAQAHAVEGDPGIVLRLLQLPGRLAEIHLALAGVVHTHRAAPLALVAGRGIAGATLLVTARYPAIRAVCERPRGVPARPARTRLTGHYDGTVRLTHRTRPRNRRPCPSSPTPTCCPSGRIPRSTAC